MRMFVALHELLITIGVAKSRMERSWSEVLPVFGRKLRGGGLFRSGRRTFRARGEAVQRGPTILPGTVPTAYPVAYTV